MKKNIVHQLFCGVVVALTGFAAQAEMGTLDSNQRQYYPRTCEMNSTDAICTFAVTNKGPAATIDAANRNPWGPLWGDLNGIQFFDNAKVPHQPSAAYFLDKFGTRRPVIVLQSGEQGWFVLEFANVDPRVTSGSFKFGTRVVGEVAVTPYVPPAIGAPPARAVSAAPAATATSPAAPVPAAASPAQEPMPAAAAPSSGCPPNDKACKAADKMAKVQSATDNTAKAADSTAKTVDSAKGLFKSFSSMFGKDTPPPPPAQTQAAQLQQAPPQQTQLQQAPQLQQLAPPQQAPLQQTQPPQ